MLFNYNTLNVHLDPITRSMQVFLNRPENNQTINAEMIFELESLFSWLTAHLEVNSVLLSSSSDVFCQGFDENELKLLDQEKIKKYLSRIQKIVHGMLHLPQTIICDIKSGAKGVGIELALGADIRISHQGSSLNFDFLFNGFIPSCGGVGLLQKLVGQSNARSWILSGKAVSEQELLRSGIILESYSVTENDLILRLLKRISNQSPVARIQAKRSLLESILPELDRAAEYESTFSYGALSTGDWQRANPNQQDSQKFLPAKELAKALKD